MVITLSLVHAGRDEWTELVGEKRLLNPAFDYVEDDPALPRVLLIGDSISIGYTVTVRELLKGKANVHRTWLNSGGTQNALGNAGLKRWIGEGKWSRVQGDQWDLIHFNWGLHDLKYLNDKKLDMEGVQQVLPDQYRENLRIIVTRLKATGARLVWANTTPVPEDAIGRVPGDEVRYNAVAEGVMKEEGVPINDLWSVVAPRLNELQKKQDVHFHPHGYETLGKAVAKVIEEQLAQPPPGRSDSGGG